MKTRYLLLCALFAALTAVGSLVKIPIGPMLVFTLQTFFVFLTGLMLEAKYALVAQIVYMAIGLLGVPIFSTGGGIAYILSPTFGYVIGFAVCAVLISLLVRKSIISFALKSANKNKLFLHLKIIVYSLLSIAVLYLFGITYMLLIKNLYLGENIGLWPIIANSAIFMLLDAAKFAIAIPLSIAVMKRMPKTLLPQQS